MLRQKKNTMFPQRNHLRQTVFGPMIFRRTRLIDPVPADDRMDLGSAKVEEMAAAPR